MMQQDAQIAIIGAGPIGIELAIALKNSGIPFLQFDKGQIGQIIYAYPAQTHFFSSSERIAISGIPIQTVNQQKCTREEYLAYLRSCVLEHQLDINTYEEVVDVRKNEGLFEIETISYQRKRCYKVPFVVFATGGTAKSRMLNVPGETLPHVSKIMEDPHLYFQKHVAIIGSRNSAVEWSLRCFHAGAKVTLICRREIFDSEHVKYWLLPELLGLVKEGKITCLFSHRVIEIMPDKVKLLTMQDKQSTIDADFVIKAIGFESDTTLLKKAGITVSENDVPCFDHDTMQTNIENAFIMGTATGGTQINFKVFIENCHVHVHKILETIGKKLNKEIKVTKKIISTNPPEQ